VFRDERPRNLAVLVKGKAGQIREFRVGLHAKRSFPPDEALGPHAMEQDCALDEGEGAARPGNHHRMSTGRRAGGCPRHRLLLYF